jgi:hypothetical protein
MDLGRPGGTLVCGCLRRRPSRILSDGLRGIPKDSSKTVTDGVKNDGLRKMLDFWVLELPIAVTQARVGTP